MSGRRGTRLNASCVRITASQSPPAIRPMNLARRFLFRSLAVIARIFAFG
ncbi:hypothetical protein SFUMM280S_03481 [Streptomyces fumanus]